MQYKLTAVLIGVAVMFLSTVSSAELPPGPHFTFTVPVNLNKLPPEITNYTITCSVGTARSLTMASGWVSNRIIGGTVNADVVVNVTVTTARDPFAHPSNATNYTCNVKLDNGGTVPYLQYLPDNGTANFPLAAGAPYIFWARGVIPR